MADVTVFRMGQMLRGVFELLQASPDGMAAKDVLEALVEKLPPTEYELGTYKGGGRRYEKIVRWSTVDTVKAGWLTKSKGRWTLTDEGRAAEKEYKNPEEFYREASRLYRRWKASRDAKTPEPEEAEVESEAEHVRQTFEEAEEQAWHEVEEHLQRMNPYDFQNLVAGLLRAMGFYVSWVAPAGKDGGLDLLAWSDPLGTRPPRIKVQVKRRREAAAVDAIRSFMAVLGDGDVGLFVSLGGFTRDAEETARAQERRQLTLINLERLFDLWVEHYDKLKERDRALLPLRPIYFLAPSE